MTKSRPALAAILLALTLMCGPVLYAGEPAQVITVTGRYDVQRRHSKVLADYLEEHPAVMLKQWEGISLPVHSVQASLAIAMAGDVGPDIFEMDIRQAVEQRLAISLAPWIGKDGVLADGTPKTKADGSPDLNGQIDADEAKWDGWMKLEPILRLMVTVDGEPYSLPLGSGTYVGLLFSRRLLLEKGLDPKNPPRNWDEFVRWCRLLYNHEKKMPAVEFGPESWAFAPWVAAAGSSILVQDRISPATGKTYTFFEQETDLRAPDTGEDLGGVRPSWHANVAHPDAVAALGLYHRLRWQPWIRDPEDGEPFELDAKSIQQGWVMRGDRRIAFQPEDIIEGAMKPPGPDRNAQLRRIGRDLAILPLFAGDLTQFETIGVNPEDLGMMPFPGRTGAQRPVLQYSNCFFMIGKDAARRGGKTPEEQQDYLNTVWDVMWRVCSVEGGDEALREKVAAGQARFMNPRHLKRLGFDDYIREVPDDYALLWDRIGRGEILEVVEPFSGKWLQFRDIYQREAIDLVLRASGRTFDYEGALKRLEHEANTGTMFERPAEELDKHRPKARVVAVLILLGIGAFIVLIIRDQLKKVASIAGVYKGWLPWIMLLPALASIGLWSYYPLSRGLLMAFQDYKIVGASTWVGLTNFIAIVLDPNFYHYIFTTFRFVIWNMVLAFLTPIILAILLTEVPRFKVFFRTLFFLPQMTSGLVVTLLWMEMFDASAAGTINSLLAPVLDWLKIGPVDWLGDPSTVMACVIIPGVWAGAGIGSLIYLAALKSVPSELYEAASIDGAGIFCRMRTITIPTILPLILINGLGAFIGTFQSMGGIFLMTFGGPGKETMVMSMVIWQEAYVNLRFHMATSYAWILGSILIGFTYCQLRILRRVDFRRASEK
jgi:multiple sugar transport system permease protein